MPIPTALTSSPNTTPASESAPPPQTSLNAEPIADNEADPCMTKAQAFSLYTSHFLSTWNVRGYEFAVIIFTAATYPDTLIAAAIRGMVWTVASICLSSSVGRWVDQSPNRLKTLLSTIIINRIAVIGASALWYYVVDLRVENAQLEYLSMKVFGVPAVTMIKGMMFAILLFLGIVEGLSGSGNMLSMERDWVVAVASPDGKPYDLTHLNSNMRRIDLICKLIAPIMISLIISATSVKTSILVTGFMSFTSWTAEVWCAKRVYNASAKLRAPKLIEQDQMSDTLPAHGIRPSCQHQVSQTFHRYIRDFQNYFSSTVWIPSMSLTLLHLSALSYGATFVTFLLSAGISLEIITIARAAGSVVEISSTVVTPVGVRILGKASHHGRYRGRYGVDDESASTLMNTVNIEEESRTETGLERLGLWGLSWQLLNLIPVVFALWALSNTTKSPPPSPPLSGLVTRILSPVTSQPILAFILFFFLSISRLGLWIYDLTTQQLTQTMTVPSQRSSFTGVEYSFVSVWTLIQHIVTLVMHRPEQFKWIALMSLIAVCVSNIAYAGWVWKVRGHLVHWEKFSHQCKCIEARPGH